MHWRKWSFWICTQNASSLKYITAFSICNYTKIVWETLCAIHDTLCTLCRCFTCAGPFPECVMVCKWIPGKWHVPSVLQTKRHVHLFGHLLNIIRATSGCFTEDFGSESLQTKEDHLVQEDVQWHTFNLNFAILHPTRSNAGEGKKM